MSSEVKSPPTRSRGAKLRRAALAAGAVVVGAIVLSGCVVIQSESATQGNVIGNTVTVSTVLCASNSSAPAPCNSPGNSGLDDHSVSSFSASGQLLIGYRIPVGVTAPPTLASNVAATDDSGKATTVPFTFSQNATYTAGLAAIAPPPAGTQWVGYVSDPSPKATYTVTGPQTATIAPTFGLPAGFVGPFTWRTVVGFRPSFPGPNDLACGGAFPGTTTGLIPGQPTVCVDSPDQATVAGAPSSLATGDLSITAPATPTVAQGSTATLVFTGIFAGGNPTASAFSSAVVTTAPGATATVPPSFTPASGSSNPIPVSIAIPASTAVGTYDVTVTATVSGQARSATGHITVKTKAAIAAATAAANKAKLTLSVKKTTLKIARKTGVPLTVTLSKKSAVSLVAIQAKPKVSVTVKKTLKAGKKTVLLVKSAKFHKGKVTLTFKGGGNTKVTTVTLS
jgi:hypothetical protein